MIYGQKCSKIGTKKTPQTGICLLDISNLPKVCFSRGLYRSVNIGHHLMSGKAACFSDPYNSTPVIFFLNFRPSFKTTNQDQNSDVDGTRVCVSLSSQTITLFGEESLQFMSFLREHFWMSSSSAAGCEVS